MSVLTPGLTPNQKQRLADALRRVAGLPLGSVAQVFMDADVAAARALDYRTDTPTPCRAIAAGITAEHKIASDTAACTYGIAVGVRLGRTFVPQPKARSKWISAEYAALSEPNRRDVQRYIRRLLRIQNPPARANKAASAQEELAAAKRWAREMGRLAWAQHNGKPVTRDDTE